MRQEAVLSVFAPGSELLRRELQRVPSPYPSIL
jgi:hypothetical protein